MPQFTSTTFAASATLTNEEIVVCDGSSGSFELTLPLASSNIGRTYFFRRKDDSNNTVSIAGAADDIIDIGNHSIEFKKLNGLILSAVQSGLWNTMAVFVPPEEA